MWTGEEVKKMEIITIWLLILFSALVISFLIVAGLCIYYMIEDRRVENEK